MTYYKSITGGYTQSLESSFRERSLYAPEEEERFDDDDVDLYDETVLAMISTIETFLEYGNMVSAERQKKKLADYLWDKYYAVPSDVGVELQFYLYIALTLCGVGDIVVKGVNDEVDQC